METGLECHHQIRCISTSWGNHTRAIVLFKKGLMEAKKQNNHFVLDGYYHLSKVYEKKGDFKTALEYKQDALVSSSNSFDITLSKSLKESELKLDIAKKILK